MIIGNAITFGVECYHEPICKECKCVHGRMCFWINNCQLGNIHNTSCALCVTKAHLDKMNYNETNEFCNFTDCESFRFLDKKLYHDDNRSTEQVVSDSLKYSRFNFLTNGGESFDNIKSFIIPEFLVIRIIWRDENDIIKYGHIPRNDYLTVIKPIFYSCLSSSQPGQRFTTTPSL